MNFDISEVLCIVFALALCAGLFYCIKKGVIPYDVFINTKNVVEDVADGIQLTGESTVFEKLMKYARIAFHAAEQLAYVGKIAPEERNEKALEMVEGFASMEDMAYGDAEKETVAAALEAMCDMNGHGEKQETGTLHVESYDVPMEEWPLEQIKCFLKDNDLGMPDTLPANEAECKVALLKYFDGICREGEKVACAETAAQTIEWKAESCEPDPG